MPINASCGNCGKILRVRDELAGKKVRCPDCGGAVTIPAAGAASAPTPAPKPAAPSPATPPPSRPAPAGKNAAPTLCPACQKPLPPGAQACPSCHHHLKLRRKIGISSAIKTADMHSQGLNVDGSKRVTNAELAEERVAQGRKMGRGMLVAVLLVLILAAVSVIAFIRQGFAPVSLAQIRSEQKAKPMNGAKPETWEPFWVYQEGDRKLSLNLPLSAVTVVNIGDTADPKKGVAAFPSPWPQGSKGWAAFVETVMPPVMNTIFPRTGRSKYVYSSESRVIPTLIAQANAAGGDYTPEKLAASAPSGPVLIWRETADLTVKGALNGAVLHFTRDADIDAVLDAARDWQRRLKKREESIDDEIASARGVGEELSREAAAAKVPMPNPVRLEMTARLSFVPFVNRDLTGGNGSYASAVVNGATFVREPHKAGKRKDGEKLRGPDDCFFAPVLLVDELKVVKASAKTKKRR